MFQWLFRIFRRAKARSSSTARDDEQRPEPRRQDLEPVRDRVPEQDDAKGDRRDARRDGDRRVLNLGEHGEQPADDAEVESATPTSAIDVVIGFDLGTSSTKVALRTPFAFNKRVVIVPLNPDCKGLARYLLPTRLGIEANGTMTLDVRAGIRSVLDMKVRLMDGAAGAKEDGTDLEATALAVGYVALVLRRVVEWSRGNRKKYFGGMAPRWQLNIGIPSAGFDDVKMRGKYDLIGRAAWWLAAQATTVTINECRKALEAVSAPSFNWGLPGDAFSVVPEVAAEVVGYARSALRSVGLHVLVDVGASTLDVCGFVLHEDQGDDRYELLTADVQRLGAFALHRHRVDRLRASGCDMVWLAPIASCDDPLAAFPESVREYFRQGAPDVGAKATVAIDEEFRKMCVNLVAVAVGALKKTRDPNSPRWRHGLPVFLAGGGSRMKFFRDVLDGANKRLKDVIIAGLRPLTLPKPQSLANEDVADGDFPFLAVAYGLSHERIEIGDIRSPSEILDLERSGHRQWESDFVSKDQV